MACPETPPKPPPSPIPVDQCGGRHQAGSDAVRSRNRKRTGLLGGLCDDIDGLAVRELYDWCAWQYIADASDQVVDMRRVFPDPAVQLPRVAAGDVEFDEHNVLERETVAQPRAIVDVASRDAHDHVAMVGRAPKTVVDPIVWAHATAPFAVKRVPVLWIKVQMRAWERPALFMTAIPKRSRDHGSNGGPLEWQERLGALTQRA